MSFCSFLMKLQIYLSNKKFQLFETQIVIVIIYHMNYFQFKKLTFLIVQKSPQIDVSVAVRLL